MDKETRQRIAVGLLTAGGGIALLLVARRIMPKMMGRMMREMMQAMMKEMSRGEGFNPPEM